VAAGCSPGPGLRAAPVPEPPPTSTTTRPAPPPDDRRVTLPSAAGATTTTVVALSPGGAAVEGTVAGPGGPVAGATVRVERLVGGQVAVTEVAAGDDGRWSVAGVAGGRYRVRAWRAPDLAQLTPALVFVGAAERASVPLEVDRFGGPAATASATPDPPVVGQPVSMGVQVSVRSVDAAGVVHSAPVPLARLELAAGSGWLVRTSPVSVTDGTGRARFELTCLAAGPQPLALAVTGLASLPLALAACVDPPGAPRSVPSA